MKTRFNIKTINLRGETKEEQELLDELFEQGAVAFGGESELGVCSKKHFGSAQFEETENNE